MCRILRVWKLKTSINTSHLLGFGNGRLWEAKSIVFYVSGRLREAQNVVFYVSGTSKRRKIFQICSVLGGLKYGTPVVNPGFLGSPWYLGT